MNGLLQGKCALVTGGAQGNGRSIALGLAAAGADIVVSDIAIERAEIAAAEVRALGCRAWAVGWNVADHSAGIHAAHEIGEQAGDIDVLVNNAGIIHRGPSDDPAAIAAWRNVLAVNLDGAYYATMAFLPALRRSRGTVINVGSVQSFVSLATLSAAYGASKGALLMLTRKLAVELAPDGIRVNGIAPGYIGTAINADIAADPEEVARRIERVPLARFGRPDEMVGTTVYLAAEQLSSYVTGVMIPIDGGLMAR